MTRKSHHAQSHPFQSHRFSISHLTALPTLALNRLIAFSAGTFVGIFMPIFLFEMFDRNIIPVLLFYAIDFGFKMPFFVPAAKLFSKIGLNKSMLIGTVGAAGFYGSFFLLEKGIPVHPFFILAMAIIFLMVLSTMYWSPFHIDFAEFSDQKKRGSQLGLFYAIQKVVGVIGPVAAGIVIATAGYSTAFAVGMILVSLSALPLLKLPTFKVTYEFGYIETFKKLFSKQYLPMSLSMMARGGENMVGSVIWPIFLFTLFKGDYLEVGIVSGIIVVIALSLELFVGKKSDTLKKASLLKWGTGIYALGWVSKAFVDSVVAVFVTSAFHNLGSIFMITPMDSMMYEQAADSGHYVDEYTVIREMALSIGRVLMLLLLVPVLFFAPLPVAFIVAAFTALGVNMLSKYHARSK